MALLRFGRNTFGKSVMGLGAAGLALALLPSAAHAENEICLPLTEINGRTLSSNASAYNHSLDNPGIISISALPGPDLRNSPQSLTNLFRDNEIGADCFVNDSIFPENGTLLSLYVAGNPVEVDGKTFFGIQELRDNPEILRYAQTEAMIARAALASP